MAMSKTPLPTTEVPVARTLPPPFRVHRKLPARTLLNGVTCPKPIDPSCWSTPLALTSTVAVPTPGTAWMNLISADANACAGHSSHTHNPSTKGARLLDVENFLRIRGDP